MTAAVLEVRGLRKHFPLRGGFLSQVIRRGDPPVIRAVEDVNLTLGEGEVLGIAGESGCGKTTLGLTLVRLYDPTAGEIRFLGEDIGPYRGGRLRSFRRQAQIIFQDPYQSLNPRFTVFDTVREPLVIHGLASVSELTDRVAWLFRRVGLSPDLLRQAAQQALRRGLVTKAELADVEEALKPFGGLAA